MYLTASGWCLAGHGYDLVNLQCAEFCVTSHVFSINGANHSVTYRRAGAPVPQPSAVRSCFNVASQRIEVCRRLPLKVSGLDWQCAAGLAAHLSMPCSRHVAEADRVSCHTVTGTQWGCADKVPQGSVPNEHGTWMYGRNGWCDGQEVGVQTVQGIQDIQDL